MAGDLVSCFHMHYIHVADSWYYNLYAIVIWYHRIDIEFMGSKEASWAKELQIMYAITRTQCCWFQSKMTIDTDLWIEAGQGYNRCDR